MWDYFSMFLWVIVAFLGLVIYTNPSFLVRHAYEGFETLQVNPKPQQEQVAVQAQPTVQKPMNVNTMLRNLDQLLNTPGNTPDVHPTMQSAPAPPTTYTAGAGRQQPAESEQKKSSTPEPLNQPAIPSSALAQGKAFQSTNPQATQTAAAVKEIIKERIVEVPVPRTCPPQKECPVCPDMQNYIRKDSIPCWACKL